MKSEVVICGAGIAGISAAYHLASQYGLRNILLVDERPALSLTSDKSTECYRNWWPGPGDAMVALMNRSIELMEELARQSSNRFLLNRRGYLYLTADLNQASKMREAAEATSKLGGGPLRVYTGGPDDPDYLPSPGEGFEDVPEGADLLLDPDLLHTHFLGLSENIVAGLHVRKAGWFRAQQLGMLLLERARACGVQLVNGRVTEVMVAGGRVRGIQLADGRRIETGVFVNAAGALLKQVGRMLGVDLPVFSELHLKAAVNDPLGILPRNSPLLIWNDGQRLPWTEEERHILEEEEMSWLLEPFPGGVHTRPEGGEGSQSVLMLWEYHPQVMEPIFPPPLDPQYPELALRGLSAMLPGFRQYFEHMPRPSIDGGYYTKTAENRPLIGPLPVEGAYIIGALSGFGLMASCASGELLAAHLAGGKLPRYTPAFALERYEDPQYRKVLTEWGDGGQL